MSTKCITKSGKVRDLTHKERLFCGHYLGDDDFVASRAALSAGYSPKSARLIGHQLLRKPHIKKELERQIRKVEKKMEIELKHKLDLLWKAAHRCYGVSDEEVQRCLESGEKIRKVFDFNPEGLVTVISEMNKMQGHYVDPKKPDGDGQSNEKLNEEIKKYEREC